ncbi:MAG TPA: hypothetical protein VL854_11815 [Nitrososphaeraceae archaeon]|nr:hypothetical protein [Nitrososphaeraceae archaeon]
MTKVYVFQDGSLASQLLQAELKERNIDVEVKDVQDLDLITEWFTKVDHKYKTYLHFCYEEYTDNNELLRKEIDKIERLGFKNQIVREYEGLDLKTMYDRCKQRGFKQIKFPKVAMGQVDPDDEMKDTVEAVRDVFKDKSDWFKNKRRRKVDNNKDESNTKEKDKSKTGV